MPVTFILVPAVIVTVSSLLDESLNVIVAFPVPKLVLFVPPAGRVYVVLISAAGVVHVGADPEP